jgi:hypothetical protein
MPKASPQTIETILRTYFRGKDENRPHLLRGVFAPTAMLQVINKASTIAFPAATDGLDAIAEVFVRQFGQTFENVYSFYMTRPRTAACDFSCDWLVGMSEKNGKNVRVGCGRYDWEFQQKPPHLASRLVISIEAMQVLPPSLLESVLAWLQRLNYPWSSAAAVIETAPGIDMLGPVLQYLGRNGKDA